ncbi:type IV secretory system conjugative DNA transfer family protein [candidate division WS5 bacterium]|uniref:Type IV secretory system conjugative DNA transfer family protein n=1 Tax=candidate division WS5 bacterium TaxID=2093353 RepID=A0A419DCX2_9BACT|nr:MAG: type IV secretory system conjugative DNA transfer family protein [candidate division WS5 bacterium]
MLIFITGGTILLVLSGLVAIYFYKRSTAYKKQIERSLKIVPLMVRVPREMGSKEQQVKNRDDRDVGREIISFMETFYANLSAIYKRGFKDVHHNLLYGQRHIALEIIAKEKEIFFYIGVPITLLDMVEKMLASQYPDAEIVEAAEHNIFSKDWKKMGICGGYLKLYKPFIYPLKTYKSIEAEPLESITNTLGKLEAGEGTAIQVLIRPVHPRKSQKGRIAVKKSQNQRGGGLMSEVIGAVTAKDQSAQMQQPIKLTAMEEEVNKAIEEKAGKPAFETIIRFVVSTGTPHRGEVILSELQGAFAQFNDQNLNGFRFRREQNTDKLVTDYIFRFFEHKLFSVKRIFFGKVIGHKNILNTEELASIFHLPNYLISSPGIKWLPAKRVETPINLPAEGTIIAKTSFRGQEEVVRLAENDKRRHVYILGQTGTGKTTTMLNMVIDDIQHGKGVAYIDPHGDAIDEILSKIPKERAEDVVVFDAGDIERPMGLNIFEAKTVEQKDLVIQEALQILYRLYDPQHTGQIFGPRFDHWLRNAALTLMADPEGGTFIEVPKVFSDDKFLAHKLKYVEDPVVRSFWIDEIGKTSDYHKSEMMGYFIGKFGAFMTNTTLRNIIGQPKSSLNLREIMDSDKILLVNLSKGRIGELNMRLLGMIFVVKLQMAAMSRADIPEGERKDFYLYVDEFQNFLTESFAQILSEARKYRLSLVVANQFIGQLTDEIKGAVFGNVGTIISFRVGPEDAEFMAKQFEPVFTQQDLINIENYNAAIRLIINGIPSRPFNIIGFPPLGVADVSVGKSIRELARLKYARPREIVDKEVLARMSIGSMTTVPSDIPRDTGI